MSETNFVTHAHLVSEIKKKMSLGSDVEVIGWLVVELLKPMKSQQATRRDKILSA